MQSGQTPSPSSFPATLPVLPLLYLCWPCSWHSSFYLDCCAPGWRESAHDFPPPAQASAQGTCPSPFYNGSCPCFISLYGSSHTWHYITKAIVCLFIASLSFARMELFLLCLPLCLQFQAHSRCLINRVSVDWLPERMNLSPTMKPGIKRQGRGPQGLCITHLLSNKCNFLPGQWGPLRCLKDWDGV